MNILIIEDDKEFGECLKETLVSEGMTVLLFQDSFSGIYEYSQASMNKDTEFDLVICDYQLDGSDKDGVETLDIIQDIHPVKTILITGTEFKPSFYRLLRKPFDPEILMSTIKELVS